jgi:hypothetical protein
VAKLRIRDAFWEIRNLGVSCSEIDIEDNDSLEDVSTQLQSITSQYQVARVPVARVDILRKLESKDFRFIECLFEVIHDLRESELSDVWIRMCNSMSYQKIANEDVRRIENEIRKGIFSTDRVALDPNFSQSLSNERYVNWLRDEIEKGGSVYEVLHKEAGVGFFTFREDGSQRDNSVLSGLYKEMSLPGVGNILLLKILEEARRRELTALTSHISTNNLAVVKTHQSLGFRISGIRYIYVKHQE